MSVENVIGADIMGLVRAIVFVLVYALLYNEIPGKGPKKRYNIWTLCVARRSVVRNGLNAILYDNNNGCSCVLDNTNFGTQF